MRRKIDFTYDELVEEIEAFANKLSGEIYESFGEDFCLAIKDNSIEGKSVNAYREITSDDIKNSMPATDAYYAYEYALGKMLLDPGCQEHGWFLDGMEQFYQLFQMEHSDSKYALIHDLCQARLHLDTEESLKVKELALLAGVDERTIRNSASSKDENSLSITKSGGTTIIENAEAIRWLSRRPDFKQTQYIANEAITSPRYFKDEAGFGKFISFKRNELGLTLEAVFAATGIDLKVLAALEQGDNQLTLNQVKKLADVLQEDANLLIKDYMRVFHLKELANLLDVGTDQFQLAFFKAKLNIESELEVYKWLQKRASAEQDLSD